MTPRIRCRLLLAALALFAAPGVGLAQYDREGRYVPSPMGVPADPHARPIPGYTGTPGGAVGAPIVPRGAMPVPPAIPRPRSEPVDPPIVSLPRAIHLPARSCSRSWTAASRLSRAEFERRCRALLPR
jgi:hypothetical protein